MKNKATILFIFLIMFSIFLLHCGGSGGDSDPSGPQPLTVTAEDPNGDNGTWTILIHIAADNNIDYSFEQNYGILSNYLATLENVKAADTGNRLKIVVLMDSYTVDTEGQLYISSIIPGYYVLTGGNFNDDLVPGTAGNINSGSVAVSQAFIDWVFANGYTSDHYMYSVFNHGGGFNDNDTTGTFGISTFGIAFDENQNDSLTHYELAQITAYLKSKNGSNKIDLFYPYACLMGGTELAYEVRNNANYMLSSEQSFPADEWSYEALSAILTSTKTSGLGIGKAFCNSAYNYFVFTSPRKFTLSLIDLSKMDALYTAIDEYADAADAFIGTSSTRASYFNDAVMNSFQMDYYYYIDFGNYLDNVLATTEIDSTVKDEATNVNIALSDAVVYKQQNGCPDASGLTIFHNNWHKVEQYSTTTYETILDFGTNYWTDYVAKVDSLVTSITADAYESDNTYTNAKTLVLNGATQNHTLHSTSDEDWIQVTLRGSSQFIISINDNCAMYSIDGFRVDIYYYYGGLYYYDYVNGGIIWFTNAGTSDIPFYLNAYSTSNSTGVYSLNAVTEEPLFSFGGWPINNNTIVIEE